MRRPHRGERDDRRLRELDVVVADDRDVLGHPAPVLHHERLHDAERQQVVDREDGVRTGVDRTCGDRASELAPLGDRALRARDDLQRGSRHGRDGGTRTLEAVGDLADAERTTDEREPATTGLQQVLRGEEPTTDVVDRHRRLVGRRGELPDEDRRDAPLPDARQPLLDGLVGGDEHALHTLRLEHAEIGVLALTTPVRVGDEHRETVFGRALLHPLGDGREERVADVRRDVRDGAAPTETELPGRVVPHEPQLVDRPLDPFLLLRRDAIGVVDVVRHRPHGDVGERRDLADSDSSHGSPLLSCCIPRERPRGPAQSRSPRPGHS
ncbi:hypothetical protein SRABI02_01668 [Plantibacter cousiniae]|nr:hypothetical protein SRABI02_01668 [Plantibacter cousiniae]